MVVGYLNLIVLMGLVCGLLVGLLFIVMKYGDVIVLGVGYVYE